MNERAAVGMDHIARKTQPPLDERRKHRTAKIPAPRQNRVLQMQRSAGNQATLRLLRASLERNQSRLPINRPDEPREKEAEQLAASVTTGQRVSPPSTAGCACSKSNSNASCAACARTKVHRKGEGSTTAPASAPSSVHDVLRTSGKPLDPGVRATMESHFGRDFGGVRIHADSAAAHSARDISAQAYTLGQHIAFGEGRYAPHADAGKKLLAHELAHTLQPQDGRILRVPDAATLAKYDTAAAAIRANPVYTGLDVTAKANADYILTTARTQDRCLYYIEHLQKIFTVPEAPHADVATKTRVEAAKTVKKEEERLATPEGKSQEGLEESASAGRKLDPLTGRGGKTYEVNNKDPNNIVVRIKIHLSPKGGGTPDDVLQVRKLEDATEKAASTRGYLVDIVFVDVSGPDVFEVGVDPGAWRDSGNFKADNASGNAHEVHHLLGLDDRYNYILSHAANENMSVKTRLYWFRHQLELDVEGKADPNAEKSIMFHSWLPPYDDDVCRVAGLDLTTCMAARQRGAVTNPPPRGTSVVGLLEVGGGVAAAGRGPGTWHARVYLGGELQTPILGVVNPTLGVGMSLVGDPVTRTPGTFQPTSTMLTSILLGVRIGSPSGSPYLSLSGGPSLASGAKLDLGGEAGVAFGYRWKVLDVSLRTSYLYDPTRVSGARNIFDGTVNVGVQFQ